MGFNEYWEKWKGQIPSTTQVLAIVILIVCIIWPGMGTIIMMCIVSCNEWTDYVIVALLQFFGAIIIIGWIWSIYWGILCLQKAS